MNIIYISNVDISKPNGPGVNEREFIISMQSHAKSNGYKSYIIIPKISGKIDFVLENHEFFNCELGDNVISGSRIFTLFFRVLHILMKRKDWLDACDLIVIRLNRDLLLLPLYFQLIRKPYYLKTLGNVYDFQNKSRTWIKIIRMAARRKVIGIVLKNSLFIDVCTPQYQQNYNHIYNLNNIIVVENAVNVDKFRIQNKIESKVQCHMDSYSKIVGYCGGSPSDRGAAQLIEAAPRLLKKYPACGILIIGDDDKIPHLKSRAAQLNVSQNIIFKGQLDYQHIVPFLNCLDVGIALDSKERIASIGNSSQKIRQYLACGVPVICALNTNHEIVNNKLAITVDPNDHDTFFNAICYWLNKSSDEINLFKKTARKYAEDNISTAITYKTRYELWCGCLNSGMHKEFQVNKSQGTNIP